MTAPAGKPGFDPDDYRMTIGEHLEELRHRLVLGLLGLVVAVVVCLIFGERVIEVFCAPLFHALRERAINTQLIYREVGGQFMTYLKISLICALVLAGPWLLYQLWQFVAAGLYAHERKTITRHIPLSIALMVFGWLFVYFAVLPLSIGFLIDFGSDWRAPGSSRGVTTQPVSTQPIVQVLDGDPPHPVDGQMWMNRLEGRLKFSWRGISHPIPFSTEGLAAPMLELGDYIDMVLLTLVMFGLAFQLPLVIMAIAKLGIVDIAGLKKARRVVYFILAILAAVIAPGDVIITMLALLVPLILLYEFGIVMARRGEQRAAAKAESDAQEP